MYFQLISYSMCFHQASSTRLIAFLQNLFHEFRRLHGFKAIRMCSRRQVVTNWVLRDVLGREMMTCRFACWLLSKCRRDWFQWFHGTVPEVWVATFDFGIDLLNTARLWSFRKWVFKRTRNLNPSTSNITNSIYITNTTANSKFHWRLLKNPISPEVISWFHQILNIHLWRSKALVDTCVASTSSVGSE